MPILTGYKGKKIIQEENAQKHLDEVLSNDIKYKETLRDFIKNPFLTLDVLSTCVQETFNNQKNNQETLENYIDSYLSLMINLDNDYNKVKEYPSIISREGEKIYRYNPKYIPNNFLYLQEDYSLDPTFRIQEKMLIDKENIFNQTKNFITSTFHNNHNINESINNLKLPKEIANYVMENLPINTSYMKSKDTLPISKCTNNDITTVCAHRALYTQILNQVFGINSKICHCFIYGINEDSADGHVNNLLKIKDNIIIEDTTLVNSINSKTAYFIKTDEKEWPLNGTGYYYNAETDYGIITYKTYGKGEYFVINNKDL